MTLGEAVERHMASNHMERNPAGDSSDEDNMTLGEAVERHMASNHVEPTTAGEDGSGEDMILGEAVERHTDDVDPHEERWSIVRLYNQKGWLVVPHDLEVIEKQAALGNGERTYTMAHRMLISIMVYPEMMEQVAFARDVTAACAVFLDPVYIQGSRAFNQRNKGRKVFCRALTHDLPSSQERQNQLPGRLRAYTAELDLKCPLIPDQLVDIGSYTRYLYPRIYNTHLIFCCSK